MSERRADWNPKGGRPPLDAEQRRTLRIQVNFTPAERQTVTERAAQSGLTVQEFCRRAVLGVEIRQRGEGDAELLHQLRRLGANLMQLLKRVNALGVSAADIPAINDTVQDIRTTLASYTDKGDA